MSCQIAIQYGDQVAALEVHQDGLTFKQLLDKVVKAIDLDNVPVDSVYFEYEDDDGDLVAVMCDADLSEAFAVHEDAGVAELSLIVKIKSPKLSVEEKEFVMVKSDFAGPMDIVPHFDETFVMELVKFLSDEHVRGVIPEVAALISALVLTREPSMVIYEQIDSKFPFLKDANLFKVQWAFKNEWESGFDAWISSLTEDQLGKVAFQIPVLVAKLVAKRKGLYRALFIKQKPLCKVLSIKQFDFGDVNVVELLENLGRNTAGTKAVDHIGTMCAQCSKCPIDGVRFKCMVCVNFDLCEACEKLGSHPSDHALMKFNTPSASYVGLLTGPNKKLFKMQLKAMKMEDKAAKKEAKLARKEEKMAKKEEKLAEKLARKEERALKKEERALKKEERALKKEERAAKKETFTEDSISKKLSPPAYSGSE